MPQNTQSTPPEQGTPDGTSEACSGTGAASASRRSALERAVDMLTVRYMAELGQTLNAYGLRSTIGIVSMDHSALSQLLTYRVAIALVSDGLHVAKPLIFSGHLDATSPSSDSSSSASIPEADRE